MRHPNKSADFSPPLTIRGPFLQTIVGVSRKHTHISNTKRTRLTLSDGESVYLEIDHDHLPQNAPILVQFHGLGGDANASYIRSVSQHAMALGCRVVRFNHRSCGEGGHQLTKTLYHSGRQQDLWDCLVFVNSRFPEAKLFACGYSLSANMLLNCLAKNPTSKISKLTSAMVVCPPVNLEKSSIKMNKGTNLFFSFYFANILKSHLKKVRPGLPFLPKKAWPKTLRDFDKRITAPVANCESRLDYYQSHSSLGIIKNIKLDTEILFSADDPIVDASDLLALREDKSLPGNIKLDATDKGGHLGFYNNKTIEGFGRRWMDYRIINWLRKHI